MTDHLPECPDTEQCVYDHNDQCWVEHSQCICEELRACEQRVLERVREAISWVQDMDEALDVIVALREWPEPPPLPPSVGVPTATLWPLRGES